MNEPQPDPLPPRRRRLGRSVFILPTLFTVGNIFCGYSAIISVMRGNYDYAAQAIGIAIVLDLLDGRIARMTNTATDFGLQLDSLADVISFGIAPSILAFVWGLSTLNHRLGWIAAFTFAMCGAMRLARFNAQAGNLKHFVGLPIPAAGGTIAAIAHFFEEPILDPLGAAFFMGAVFVLSFLMVSSIRYSSFKTVALGKKSHLIVLVMALLVAAVFYYSKWTLLTLAVAYVSSGILMRLFSMARRKKTNEEITLSKPLEHH